MPEGYCVKERKKVEIKDPQQVTMKNGRPAILGILGSQSLDGSRNSSPAILFQYTGALDIPAHSWR